MLKPPTHKKVPVEILQLLIDEVSSQRDHLNREARRLTIILNGVMATAEDVIPPISVAEAPKKEDLVETKES